MQYHGFQEANSALEVWGRNHPTLEMRRHITQITIGSMTQYMAQVNGMPKSVEKHLIKVQREFMWAGRKSSPVQRDMLLAPKDVGGKDLFDITARNETLHVMRLKSYLELDPEKRATWAYVADNTIAKHPLEKPKVEKGLQVNTFMQSWSPKRSDLPPRLKEMVNVAKRYGIIFDTHQPTQEIRRKLPLWHHFGEDRRKHRVNNSIQCKCLRSKHEAKTMGDAEVISARLDDPRHRADRKCTCLDCIDDRAFQKCQNPHACAKMARYKVETP
ncbi:hypothetical protein C8R43DRAFT_905988 [Mycena crocata]|nr:hypothetical protein C8R43DRAFT_905988 [Mycena crocata]